MTLTTYHNFDLLLTRAGARYKAIVVDAPAGEESVLFDPPFAADALPRLEGLARGVTRGATRHIGAAGDQCLSAGDFALDARASGRRAGAVPPLTQASVRCKILIVPIRILCYAK
jgi:hypothetical protein